jgi:hypothetical protein
MAVSGCGPARTPFVDLAPFLPLEGLAEVHDEICLALARLPSGFTGGSHRSLGILPKNREDDVFGDYGEVFATLDDEGLATLAKLGDSPRWRAPLDELRAATLGEERDLPLSWAQQRWLLVRHRVYFPWTTFHELMPVDRWDDKDDLAGKDFTREAKAFFPKTLRFLRRLPLVGIGRASILGLAPFHHGTVHRDSDPAAEPAEFIMLVPTADKQLFVWDDAAACAHLAPKTHALWFHDGDYHGVAAAPYFRYSVRVDGPFNNEFRQKIGIHEPLR